MFVADCLLRADESVKEALVEALVDCIWWFLTVCCNNQRFSELSLVSRMFFEFKIPTTRPRGFRFVKQVCNVVDYEIPDVSQTAGLSDASHAQTESLEERIRTSTGGQEEQGPHLLHVQAFTPMLGTLLLNPSANVNASARYCVVNLLTRLREADKAEHDADPHSRHDSGQLGQQQQELGAVRIHFGPEKRKLFERELLHQVVIGMAHLQEDNNLASGQHSRVQSGAETRISQAQGPSEQSQTQFKSQESLDADQRAQLIEPRSPPPPPSAADDEALLSTLTGSVFALATQQFLAREEPQPSTSFLSSSPPLAGAEIARPPSPIPNIGDASTILPPVPEYEPDFAHVISQAGDREVQRPDEVVMQDVDTDIGRAPGPIASRAAPPRPSLVSRGSSGRISPPLRTSPGQEDHRMQISATLLQTPHPEKYTSEPPMVLDHMEQTQSNEEEEMLDGLPFSEEQAAVGKLASMSLMAAVTANGELFVYG